MHRTSSEALQNPIALPRQKVVSLDMFRAAASGKSDRKPVTSILLSPLRSSLKGGIFDAYMDLAEGLEAVFGRKVDLVTERSTSQSLLRNLSTNPLRN